MVAPAAGEVVTVLFPFSDLTGSKVRPAVVLADAGRGDWILAQMTSKSYGDVNAVAVEDEDFATGSLSRTSYVRPGKVFTASANIILAREGRLHDDSFRRVATAVVYLLQSNIPL